VHSHAQAIGGGWNVSPATSNLPLQCSRRSGVVRRTPASPIPLSALHDVTGADAAQGRPLQCALYSVSLASSGHR